MRAKLPLIAVAALLAGSAPALAQTRPAPSSSYGADRDERPETPEAPEQDASQDLVRQLNLRSDQQAAFRDYQSAFQAGSQTPEGDDDGEVARLAAMTTPQRLDDAARHMDQDRAAFERASAATRRFYATLDSTQRRTFDRLTAPREGAEDDEGADTGRPSDPQYAPSPPAR